MVTQVSNVSHLFTCTHNKTAIRGEEFTFLHSFTWESLRGSLLYVPNPFIDPPFKQQKKSSPTSMCAKSCNAIVKSYSVFFQGKYTSFQAVLKYSKCKSSIYTRTVLFSFFLLQTADSDDAEDDVTTDLDL